MTDLDLLVAGALVTFLSAAGAYVAIRRRANEAPVQSYESAEEPYATATIAERRARAG